MTPGLSTYSQQQQGGRTFSFVVSLLGSHRWICSLTAGERTLQQTLTLKPEQSSFSKSIVIFVRYDTLLTPPPPGKKKKKNQLIEGLPNTYNRSKLLQCWLTYPVFKKKPAQ